MKNVLSVIAIALLVGMVVPVWAAEEAEPTAAPAVSSTAGQEAAATFTADQWLAAQSTVTLAVIISGGGQCNQAVCGPGQFCCNYSCSTCAPQGGACTQQYCPPEF